MKERYLTMSKVSDKFIKDNKRLIHNVESFIEKLENNRYNSKDIEKIKDILKMKEEEYCYKRFFG